MNTFKIIIKAALEIMQFDLNMFGYTVSMWKILIFFAVASALVAFFFRAME